ncbi:glycosyltransferase [Cytobacillus praedii]|uniref:glycosyltransferase n=1 Tax=Cytobacillus praedii TaxID=1742358 RepID=UPI002E24E3C7|nr:glycosyltransferase [Cytobacillus praedii]
MNDQKIAFIYCYNDELLLNESFRYIQSLNIPVGFEIEIIPVENASSMAAGYNFAMEQTDAKYKVYLHQDVFIINRNFISDVLDVFQQDKKIGLLGMVGAKVLPTNGIWWEAHEKFGKVYDSHTGSMELLSFNYPTDDIEYVQAIDGLMMVTQYDIPWREEIFDGWHFYDISQSVEFLKNGYKVAISQQEEPWCIHDCGIVNVKNGFEEYRNLFLDEYSKFLFPLVSVLIPTYNRPEYLKEALESVLQQTYRNIEIIICDDSTNDKTEIMIQSFLENNQTIRYFKNSERLGQGNGLANAHKCLNLSTGEFVNFLMDDDRFSHEKISKMVNYFIQIKNITLVTSYRQVINENGDFLNPIEATKKLFNEDTLVDSKELGNYILCNMLNVIGEPTTVLFKKNDLEQTFGKYLGRQYSPLSDVSTWLHLLLRGSAVYIAEPLSYFRLHGDQNAYNIVNIITGSIEWYHLIKISHHSSYFVDNLYDTLNVWLANNIHIIKKVKQLSCTSSFVEENKNLVNEFNRCYKDCLKTLLEDSTSKIEYPLY